MMSVFMSAGFYVCTCVLCVLSVQYPFQPRHRPSPPPPRRYPQFLLPRKVRAAFTARDKNHTSKVTKWCLSLRIILANKTGKNHKLVFDTGDFQRYSKIHFKNPTEGTRMVLNSGLPHEHKAVASSTCSHDSRAIKTGGVLEYHISIRQLLYT